TSIVQAEAQLQQARANLTQAQQDLTNGSQSGLGYGGSTATDQKVNADAALANARTMLNEAQRIYNADLDLFNNKAISRNQLDQDKAKLDQAQVSFNQAAQQRRSLNGQLSRSGQVLQDRYKSSQEAVRQAEVALSAAREQQSGGSTTAAYAQAQKAQIDYQYADEQAASTQLRAPFAGVIESMASQTNDPLRPLQPGDTIAAGQGIFTLAATDSYVVRALVDEQDVINVQVGQAANITGQDFPGKIGGHVSFISPVAQKSTDPSSTARQVLTTIRLDKSPTFLKDGMSVDVDILTKNIAHTIAAPTGAIVTEKGKKYVYVVRGGVAKKRAIVTGQASDTQTIIKSGLAPKDVIIIESNPLIKDGTRINSVMSTPKPSPTA
ncbi:MAG: efflux RND transporter periplasmic adaptor subunit, partial [Candidatus Eremiobacteraeota bacterium]|nr:efflux RND transporter periplasmic adaptor subunit [Candidatus Eremiobacteraeota bacterium]